MITAEMRVEVLDGDLTDRLYSEAKAAGVVAWDIETSGLDWSGDLIGTCQIATPDEISIVVMNQSNRPKLLSDLLSDATVKKVFHHAPFDLRFMSHRWAVQAQNVACTKIASKILDPGLGSRDHSLLPVLRRHLDITIKKDQQVSDWLATDLTDAQLSYAASDVAHLLRLYQVLAKKCQDAGVAAELAASYQYLPTRVALDLRGSGDVFAY